MYIFDTNPSIRRPAQKNFPDCFVETVAAFVLLHNTPSSSSTFTDCINIEAFYKWSEQQQQWQTEDGELNSEHKQDKINIGKDGSRILHYYISIKFILFWP